MRQIFPTGAYIRRTGDTMTGPLTIKRDAASYTDPHLRLQNITSGAGHLPIGFYNEAGGLRALVRSHRLGWVSIEPTGGYTVYMPGTGLVTPVYWQPYGFPSALTPRRVMMVESMLFGGV